MDHIKQRLLTLLKQYRFAVLILALGLVLMLLPARSEQIAEVAQPPAESCSAEEQLEEILSQMKGVGKVRVLLTVARGEQVIYVYDEDRSETDVNREAVIVTNSERTQTGLVSQVLPASYLGAVIVCQGGENPAVKLAIVEAVCDATGLTADKITVLKMK